MLCFKCIYLTCVWHTASLVDMNANLNYDEERWQVDPNCVVTPLKRDSSTQLGSPSPSAGRGDEKFSRLATMDNPTGGAFAEENGGEGGSGATSGGGSKRKRRASVGGSGGGRPKARRARAQ